MKRLDQWLVDLNFVPSRTKAKELLLMGAVEVQVDSAWVTARSASQIIELLRSDQVRITDSRLLKYVARSGLKLEGVLSDSKVSPKGCICFDIGQSTGGFTDCLLRAGAQKVVGVDVGKGQLAKSLKMDSRVEFYERVNARHPLEFPVFASYSGKVDILVMDISFISVTKVLKGVLSLLKPGGNIFVLIKPQFELGSQALNKSGVVMKTHLLEALKEKMLQHFENIGLQHMQFYDSPLQGRDGNREFFIHAKK